MAPGSVPRGCHSPAVLCLSGPLVQGGSVSPETTFLKTCRCPVGVAGATPRGQRALPRSLCLLHSCRPGRMRERVCGSHAQSVQGTFSSPLGILGAHFPNSESFLAVSLAPALLCNLARLRVSPVVSYRSGVPFLSHFTAFSQERRRSLSTCAWKSLRRGSVRGREVRFPRSCGAHWRAGPPSRQFPGTQSSFDSELSPKGLRHSGVHPVSRRQCSKALHPNKRIFTDLGD